jgi:hypothetical protein
MQVEAGGLLPVLPAVTPIVAPTVVFAYSPATTVPAGELINYDTANGQWIENPEGIHQEVARQTRPTATTYTISLRPYVVVPLHVDCSTRY